jgi:hypothetical protein
VTGRSVDGGGHPPDLGTGSSSPTHQGHHRARAVYSPKLGRVCTSCYVCTARRVRARVSLLTLRSTVSSAVCRCVCVVARRAHVRVGRSGAQCLCVGLSRCIGLYTWVLLRACAGVGARGWLTTLLGELERRVNHRATKLGRVRTVGSGSSGWVSNFQGTWTVRQAGSRATTDQA